MPQPTPGLVASLLTLLCVLGAASPVAAVTLERHVASAAGGWTTGGDYVLGFTLGEPAVGISGEPGNPVVEWAGFWGSGPASLVGVGDPVRPVAASGLWAWPNPFFDRVSLRWSAPAGVTARDAVATIFDARGRRVRQLASPARDAATLRFEWDGRDARGAPVGAGLYFCRIEAGPHVEVRRLARLH